MTIPSGLSSVFFRFSVLCDLPFSSFFFIVVVSSPHQHEGTSTVLEVDENTTILEAALDNDIDLPHDCKLGVCLTCPSKVVSGDVDQSDGTLEDSVTALVGGRFFFIFLLLLLLFDRGSFGSYVGRWWCSVVFLPFFSFGEINARGRQILQLCSHVVL